MSRELVASADTLYKLAVIGDRKADLEVHLKTGALLDRTKSSRSNTKTRGRHGVFSHFSIASFAAASLMSHTQPVEKVGPPT